MDKRVLIAPLDWGLGHTTRCIPLIQSFLRARCTVIVACHPVAKQLLQAEFPQLLFLSLPGYNVHYSHSKRGFALKILQQIPKILWAIKNENRWLKKMVLLHKIDLVVSDNRYGFYHKKVPSFLITHQLSIQTPFRWLSKLIQALNYRMLNRFGECWVPDYEGTLSIAGKLSHPSKLPNKPVRFIGPLSRFSVEHTISPSYKWLILISGPEPARTQLETAIIRQQSEILGTVLLVRGLPASNVPVHHFPGHWMVHNHLPTPALAAAYRQSEFVISRSGYTTVMEILGAQKKAILIPTPGQTEQEYLATHLHRQHWCFACNDISQLVKCLREAASFAYLLPSFPQTSLDTFIENVVERYND